MTAAELVGCSPAELTAAGVIVGASFLALVAYTALTAVWPDFPRAGFLLFVALFVVCAAVSAGLGGVLVSGGFAVLAVHAAVAALLTRDAAKRAR